LSSVLQNDGKSWSEFYRFVNRHKGNRENIPTIKDCNGGLITDPVDKANNLNYYAYVSGTSQIKLQPTRINPSPLKLALLGSG